jgi:ubiquinone/menaquinone biosynthesis C-methylase UbiE/uncharacterized protein YbaR (Trm112 family)
MLAYLIDDLICPACHAALNWHIYERDGERIQQGLATCIDCQADYPLRDGIAIFLLPDLPRNDLWEKVESGLAQFLRANPEKEKELLDSSIENLNPADKFFRAMLLEEQGEFEKSRALYQIANAELYTPEYQLCYESQVHFLLDRLASSTVPILDLASGRSELVEAQLRNLGRPVAATDFSLRVLRRDRRWFAHLGLDEHLSLLAFDARCTPFRDRSLPCLTTNLGLPNVEQPGELLNELRRVVSGELLAISYFIPPEDTENLAFIQKNELSPLFLRAELHRHLSVAGWQAHLVNSYNASARPTPTSRILDGAGIDAIPAAPTTLQWSLVIAI